MSFETLWETPDSWTWTLISEIGDVVAGGTPSSKEPTYWGDDINWISPADLTGYVKKTIRKGNKSISVEGLKNSSAKVMPAGSVHFSSRAPIGYVVISSEPMATNQGFKSLVPARGIFNEYVYYYLKASKQLAEKRASGTTFLELSGKAFGLLPLPLPPLNEQKRIVAKIEELFLELDNGIAALKAAREQLKVYRQAVLKHAFEGKLTATWREENADKLETPEQLLARIQQEREARYQQQLGEWKVAVKEWEAQGKEGKKPGQPTKPKSIDASKERFFQLDSVCGWYMVPLELLITEINQGWSPKCELNREPKTGEWAVIKTSAIQSAKYISNECKPLPSEYEPRPSLEINTGDLLMTRKGPRVRTGVVCLVRETRSHSMLCDTVYRFRALEELVLPEFLELALNSPLIVAEIDKRKSGISDSGISLNHGKIKTLHIPIATSFEEQRMMIELVKKKLEFVDIVESSLEKELQRAETLRQSILKKVFSGQLVPQDPNDEPASALLARIKAEKAAAQVQAKPAVGKRGRKKKEVCQ